jgi:entericidin B
MLFKRMFVAVVIAALGGAAISGCNTFRGAGEDIERGGEAIQDAAES